MNLFSKIVARATRHLSAQRNKAFLSSLGKAGTNVAFRHPVCLEEPENIFLGNDVSVAAFVHMWGHGRITIGSRVMIASHTAITTISHDHTQTVMHGTLISKPILIEDDVWIGTHAVILPGVVVGKGAVIGAGAIVTKNVPPNAIVVGVPGVVVKYRM